MESLLLVLLIVTKITLNDIDRFRGLQVVAEDHPMCALIGLEPAVRWI